MLSRSIAESHDESQTTGKMPVVFIVHGNPMNALQGNKHTQA